jgi:hypothetical protein
LTSLYHWAIQADIGSSMKRPCHQQRQPGETLEIQKHWLQDWALYSSKQMVIQQWVFAIYSDMKRSVGNQTLMISTMPSGRPTILSCQKVNIYQVKCWTKIPAGDCTDLQHKSLLSNFYHLKSPKNKIMGNFEIKISLHA